MLGANVGRTVSGTNGVLGAHVVSGAEHVTNQRDQSGSPKNTKICTFCTSARIPLKLIHY